MRSFGSPRQEDVIPIAPVGGGVSTTIRSLEARRAACEGADATEPRPRAERCTALTYFYLHWRDEEGASVAEGDDDPELDMILDEPATVDEWSGLELRLPSGGLTDYLANDVGVRLCSLRLRDLIESHRSATDEVQWLQAQVLDSSGQGHPYFVLHFVSHPDVLDRERTITARDDFVVKAVLDRNRVAGHNVFAFPGAEIRVIVSGVLRHAILAAGCTGVDFSELPIT